MGDGGSAHPVKAGVTHAAGDIPLETGLGRDLGEGFSRIPSRPAQPCRPCPHCASRFLPCWDLRSALQKQSP